MDEHPVIAKLLKRMDSHPGFAGLGASIQVISQLNDDEEAGAREITATILRDAALTAKLLRLANASNRAARNVSTIDQAIVILGMNTVKSVAISLALLDSLSHQPQSQQLHAEIVAAYFCGTFAAEIARHSSSRFNTQEAQICGLLQNLGRMMAIYYLYEDIERSRTLQADQNLSEDEAVAKTLGVDFDDIGIAIAQHWNLPDGLQQSLIPKIDKMPPRSAVTSMARNRFCSIFARRITDALFRTPQSRERGAITHEMNFFRHVLQLRDDEVRAWIHTAFEETGRLMAEIAFPSDVEQARSLLRKPSERVLDWLSPQDSLIKGSHKDGGKKPIEVIYQILRLVHDEFNFDLTLLCLPSGSSDLVAIAGVGRDASRVTTKFRCHGAKHDIFRSVSARRVDMYISDAHAPATLRLLPDWYPELVRASSFAILPLEYDGHLLGMLYGDYSTPHPKAPEALTQTNLQAWRARLIQVLHADTHEKLF